MSCVVDIGKRAQAASRVLATAPTDAKNAALEVCAVLLHERRGELLAANQADLDAAASRAWPRRRSIVSGSPSRGIDAMAAGLRTVAALADPVGEVLDGNRRPNGLLIERVRVPLGVIAIIYENRPNVTSDAFGLCVKSANAAILRGSATALRSNVAIGAIAARCAHRCGSARRRARSSSTTRRTRPPSP